MISEMKLFRMILPLAAAARLIPCAGETAVVFLLNTPVILLEEIVPAAVAELILIPPAGAVETAV